MDFFTKSQYIVVLSIYIRMKYLLFLPLCIATLSGNTILCAQTTVGGCTYQSVGSEPFNAIENAQSAIDSARIQLREGVVITHNGRVQLTFQNKKLIEELHYSSGAADKKEILRKTNTYHENRLIARLIEIFEDNAWKESQRHLYQYLDDNLNSCTCQVKRHNDWENSMQYYFSYDSQQNVIAIGRKYWANDQWQNLNLHTLTYNENALCMEEVYMIWEAETWKYTQRYTYTYDTDKTLDTRTRQTWEEGEWELSARDIYKPK